MSIARNKRNGKKRVRLIYRIRRIPHLFAKVIIVHCIIVVTIAAYFSLVAQAKGAEMTALYTAVAATFISELAMLLLKTLFKKDKEDESDETDVDEPNV